MKNRLKTHEICEKVEEKNWKWEVEDDLLGVLVVR